MKQIVYESETRVFIGEEKPKKPINAIDIIALKLPVDAKVGEDKFCFAGNDSSYSLSPYFNSGNKQWTHNTHPVALDIAFCAALLLFA